MDIDGGVDPCSGAYKYSGYAGMGAGGLALGGAAATKAFVPGGLLNSNKYLRLGYGRGKDGDKVF